MTVHAGQSQQGLQASPRKRWLFFRKPEPERIILLKEHARDFRREARRLFRVERKIEDYEKYTLGRRGGKKPKPEKAKSFLVPLRERREQLLQSCREKAEALAEHGMEQALQSLRRKDRFMAEVVTVLVVFTALRITEAFTLASMGTRGTIIAASLCTTYLIWRLYLQSLVKRQDTMRGGQSREGELFAELVETKAEETGQRPCKEGALFIRLAMPLEERAGQQP